MSVDWKQDLIDMCFTLALADGITDNILNMVKEEFLRQALIDKGLLSDFTKQTIHDRFLGIGTRSNIPKLCTDKSKHF